MSACGPISVSFFTIVVFFGSFYLLNLMLAVVALSYEEEAEITNEVYIYFVLNIINIHIHIIYILHYVTLKLKLKLLFYILYILQFYLHFTEYFVHNDRNGGKI